MPTAEVLQCAGGERRFVERRILGRIEVPREPAGSDALMSPAILDGDESRDLKQVDERWSWDFGAQNRFGNEKIAALDRSIED